LLSCAVLCAILFEFTNRGYQARIGKAFFVQLHVLALTTLNASQCAMCAMSAQIASKGSYLGAKVAGCTGAVRSSNPSGRANGLRL
jgi:hypothetical protein